MHPLCSCFGPNDFHIFLAQINLLPMK
uniref:Uncharacterized protein n=1 Tax=Arundo donax TaxID=35708 RepID=A0A0A8YA75_ARUDO